MREQATLLHVAEGPTDSRISLALPPDLLKQVRKRVRILALLLLAAFASDLVFAVGSVISLLLTGGSVSAALVEDGTLFYLANVVAVAASLVLWWAAGSQRVSPSRLLTLGLGYEVLVCFMIAIANSVGTLSRAGFLPNLTWVPVVVILFPVLLPGPPRKMLVGSILAASTVPIALALLDVSGRVVADPQSYRTARGGLSVRGRVRVRQCQGRLRAGSRGGCRAQGGKLPIGGIAGAGRDGRGMARPTPVCWPGPLPSSSSSKI